MIAAFFRAVNRAKTVPPSPFRGDWGSFFAQISGVVFCGKCCVWGIIGGVYIQAIKIPDRAHKTLRRAAGHDRRQNGGGQEPGQDGRQISGRRRRQIGPGVAWCEPEPWAADRRRGGCGLCGRGRWGVLMQARGQCKPPAGRGTAGTAIGSHQPGDRTATTAPGRDSPPPAGAERATKARANASGQAEDHTKRARALAHPREVGTPAPAKGTAGPQAKPCGFGSAKFF
nr:MAG TPA: hypothetical protein [Caudoviricetes sp.]